MPRCRCRVRLRFFVYAVVINAVLFVLYNLLHLDRGVSLPQFSVNASKNFIQKLVPKPKPILTFEVGRPKPEGKPATCRFTQSEGLQILAEDYLYPKDDIVDKNCPKHSQNICRVSGSLSHVSVSCEQNPCRETVRVGSLNKETGEVEWEDVNSSKLEQFIKDVTLKSVDYEYPFFFLKCGDVGTAAGNGINSFTQMLSVPLVMSANTSEQNVNKEIINVNILFLDGISRRHFYRSLPKTVKEFREININPLSTSNVLDFELYQALRAKQAETLLGFITGEKYNKSRRPFAKPLLSRFKDAGYQTLWQEDLCWKLDAGFVAYFGLDSLSEKDKWLQIKKVMESNDIDSLGITHSSCHIFKENQIKNMGDYAKRSICFNGYFQHEYFLEFLGRYLTEVDSRESSKPLMSITSLNLGQEKSGKHIQTLDKSLATFVQKMAGDKNTITFLISDHGNTYEQFPIQTTEGQYEQYNPFLFMILPNFVARKLGELKKNNLLNNQLRLISVSDIHDTVMTLVKNPKELNVTHSQGIFKEIDFNRDCTDLGLSSSSLCICDGWSSKQHANVLHYIIAEFALGQLNNMIASQYLSHRSVELPFAFCERLQGLGMGNISQKRIENGYIITKMDIYVQTKEIFTVRVRWHGDDSPAMGMTLADYKRKQRNGGNSLCSSSVVDQNLCVCQATSQGKGAQKIMPNWKRYGNVFGRKTKSENRHKHCLYLLSRHYGSSTVFEAANMCDDTEYKIRMIFDLENTRTPVESVLNATISPRYVQFLTFVTPLHLTNPGTWEFEFEFSFVKLKV